MLVEIAAGTVPFAGIVLSSDGLYLPALFDDIIAGIPLAGWSLTPSPYFFPDMLLYFAVRTIFSLTLGTVVYASLQVALIFWSHDFLLASAGTEYTPERKLASHVAGIMFMIVLYLFSPAMVLNFLVSANHTGNYILTVVSLGLLARYVDGASPVYPLAVVSFAALLSDQLYLSVFVVPALAVLLLQKKFKILLQLMVVFILNYYITGLILEMIRSRYIFIPKVNLPAIILKNFSLQQLFNPGNALQFLGDAGPVIMVTGLILFLAGKKITNFVWQFYFLSALTVLGSLYLTGSLITHDYPFRYMQSVYLFWILLATLSVPDSLMRKSSHIIKYFRKYEYILLLLFIPAGLLVPVFKNPAGECIASNSQTRQGLGDYWNSKKIQLLSGGAVKVNQLTPELAVYHWINNLEWYLHNDADFILPERLDREKIIHTAGVPDRIETCIGTEVWIYAHGQLQKIVNDHRLYEETNPSARLWLKKTPGNL